MPISGNGEGATLNFFFPFPFSLLFFFFLTNKLKKMNGITPAEKQKYAEIFQARGQVNGYMPGNKASKKI